MMVNHGNPIVEIGSPKTVIYQGSLQGKIYRVDDGFQYITRPRPRKLCTLVLAEDSPVMRTLSAVQCWVDEQIKEKVR